MEDVKASLNSKEVKKKLFGNSNEHVEDGLIARGRNFENKRGNSRHKSQYG